MIGNVRFGAIRPSDVNNGAVFVDSHHGKNGKVLTQAYEVTGNPGKPSSTQGRIHTLPSDVDEITLNSGSADSNGGAEPVTIVKVPVPVKVYDQQPDGSFKPSGTRDELIFCDFGDGAGAVDGARTVVPSGKVRKDGDRLNIEA